MLKIKSDGLSIYIRMARESSPSSLFREAFEAARRIKSIVIFTAVLYAVSFIAGCTLTSIGNSYASELEEEIQRYLLSQEIFAVILEYLRTGNLVAAILITFTVNLCLGAFLTTTLPGILPLLGAIGISFVGLLRGFVIGLTYPQVLGYSPLAFIVGIGTILLELGAYVFSSAAGVNISLAPIFPARYETESRMTAFKEAWKDAARIFVIVIILLGLGAIWEMVGIYFLIQPI